MKGKTMNKEKQIEEMAKAIEQARIKATDTTNSMNYGFGGWYAKELYNAGYRKASEVAREIFADIEQAIAQGETITAEEFDKKHIDSKVCCRTINITANFIRIAINELKKKYTESENDDG